MIVRGPRPTESFTVIPNAVLNDHRLTWKARGILIWLLSKPDHWRTNSAAIAREAPDGLHAVRSALTELRALGYLHTTRTQDPAGRWTTTSTVYDTPTRHPVDNHGHN